MNAQKCVKEVQEEHAEEMERLQEEASEAVKGSPRGTEQAVLSKGEAFRLDLEKQFGELDER